MATINRKYYKSFKGKQAYNVTTRGSWRVFGKRIKIIFLNRGLPLNFFQNYIYTRFK